MDEATLRAQILQGVAPQTIPDTTLKGKLKKLSVKNVKTATVADPNIDGVRQFQKMVDDAIAGAMADPATVTDDPRYDDAGTFALAHDALNMAGVGAVVGTTKSTGKALGRNKGKILKALENIAQRTPKKAEATELNVVDDVVRKYLPQIDDVPNKATGFSSLTATPEQQDDLLRMAKPGSGKFEVGDIYTQEVAGGARPVIISKVNADGSVEGFYAGAISPTEASFGIDPNTLQSAKWYSPSNELKVPETILKGEEVAQPPLGDIKTRYDEVNRLLAEKKITGKEAEKRLRAIADEANLTQQLPVSKEVSQVITQPTTFYRGGDSRMPKGVSAREVLSREHFDKGSDDVIPLSGIDLDKIKSDNLRWVAQDKNMASTYGQVQELPVNSYRVVAKDGAGGLLIEVNSKPNVAQEQPPLGDMTVYRGVGGTKDANMLRDTIGKGRYFSESKDVAKQYGEVETASLAGLNIKKFDNINGYDDFVQPIYLKMRDSSPMWDGTRESALKIMSEAKVEANKLLAQQGFDGVSTKIHTGENLSVVFPESISKISSPKPNVAQERVKD